MSDPYLEEYIKRLFAGVAQRDDRSELVLARPTEVAPLLLQSPATVAAVTLAVELLEIVRRFGGSSVKSSSLTSIRQRLRDSFADSEWAHLEDELQHTLMWLEAAFDPSRRPVEEEEEGYPVAPREALVKQALSEQKDLYVEFLRRDEGGMLRFHRARVRPISLEERELTPDQPELHVVGHLVPMGDPIALPLTRLRWLMVVRRLTPLLDTPTARLLTFPGPPDEDPQD